MRKLLILLFLCTLTLDAAVAAKSDANVSLLEEEQMKHIAELQENFYKIEQKINAKKSVWLHAYSNYETYNKVSKKLKETKKLISQLLRKRQISSRKTLIKNLRQEVETLSKQIALLPRKSDEPFSDLLKTGKIPENPKITNPFDIFSGFSYIKSINGLKEDFLEKEEQLREVNALLEQKQAIISDIYFATKKDKWKENFEQINAQTEAFENAMHVAKSTGEVYSKSVDDLVFVTTFEIQEQAKQLLSLVIIIVVLFVFAFLIKIMIKKYIKDHERYYMANKIINFVNFFIVAMILFMNYIDNVSYLVTVLGFASAGIAIAMKDWFMSVLGWLVIVVGGSIHVGDRIKFQKDGMEYVGDVLDISLFRITLMEDITLTTYMVNRRAGRIIFVPNNYVFTSMIANYSHNSLKTVWDGIDITITFDSNHKKASYLTKEIARKYSKGYTDITRKQLNKLRENYSLKNTNVDPRCFSFAEVNGIKISVWYLTNAFATLTLRSTISTEILDAFKAEDDIHIAYPTQTIGFTQTERPAELPPEMPQV